MKKFIIYLFLTLLVPLSALADGTCTHRYKRWTCKENSNYKLYFECNSCHQTIDIASWKETEDYGINVVDPYLDVEADEHDVGQEKMIVTGEKSCLQAWVVGNEKNSLLAYVNQYSKPSPVLNLTLPWTPKLCKATLVMEIVVSSMVTKDVETEDGTSTTVEMQSDTIFTTKQVEYKPFHSVAGLDVREQMNTDEDGLIHPTNQVRFWVQAPQDADIMDGDAFIIYRYKNPGDEVTILTEVDITKPDSIITVNGVKYGEYRYVDNDDVARYGLGATTSVVDSVAKLYANCDSINKLDKNILDGFYTHPSQNVYYGVMRALVNSIWPSHNGTFVVNDSVNVNSQLPSVSKVDIKQHASWQTDKTSDIRITLDNPLPWEYNDLMDADMVHEALAKRGLNYRRYVWDEGARIRVLRSSPESEWYGNEDPVAAEFFIEGSDVKWNAEKGAYEAVLEDMQGLPYTHYYYTAEVVQNESNIPLSGNNVNIKSSEEDANLCYSAVASLISGFTASQEKYPGAVLLKWKLGSGKCDHVAVYRRNYSKDGKGEWKHLESFDSAETEYMDESALAGYAYDYQLEVRYSQGNKVISDSRKVIGWGSYRSSISGHLLMPNGTGMANQKVVIKRKEPIYISDVVDSLGYVIMPGYNDGAVANAKPLHAPEVTPDTYNVLFTDTVYTDASGAFTFDSLLYKGDGTKYLLTLPDTYTYDGKDVQADIPLPSLSDKNNMLKDERFVMANVATITGCVLFSESTVPVIDAYFMLDDKPMTTANGDSIKTDADGNFKLTVPAGKKVTLRVMKKGHTFANDGFLMNDDTAEKGSLRDIPQVQDYTRVRLVGRLAGGNIQADKELGFGMSKNNLGDNPTIVLELEGNNTSWLVYKKDKPDDTTIKTTVKHPFTGLYPNKELKTEVSYEKKRIVINPDPLSGEFFVDLIPTKYKVTQLSAEGYSTLYSKGEGLDIIDLGKDISEKVKQSDSDHSKSYTYNSTYVRTYHAPVTVTYQQLKYGSVQKFFGEGETELESLTGNTMNYAYGWYDENARETNYLFGYPVFKKDSRYFLKAYAHEDYYYNNNVNLKLDEVAITSGKLHVQNGLISSNESATYALDSLGTATFPYTVGDPMFNLTGTAALRSLNMSVEFNDMYYEAEPLRGYIVGSAEVGADALPLCSADDEIKVVDVLSDPPGSTSYAYRKKGTTYNWNVDKTEKFARALKLDLTIGFAWKTDIVIAPLGAGGTQSITEGSIGANFNINMNLPTSTTRSYGEYTMTLNEEIRTSNDPTDVGAMADVYIGTVNTMDFYKTKAISVIDKEVYNLLKSSIDAGAVKVIQASADGKYYLVIGSQLQYGTTVNRTFAYSQKHIVGTVIPDLWKMQQALLEQEVYVDGNDTKYQDYAKAQKRDVYFMDSEGNVHFFAPKDDGSYVNRYENYGNTARKWQDVIKNHEQKKLNLIGKPANRVKEYSVAGGAVSYDEEASGYYVSASWENKFAVSSFGAGASGGNKGLDGSNQKDKDTQDAKVSIAGVYFSISGGLTATPTTTSTNKYSKTESKGYGFYMNTNDNGYMDVDVYAEKMTAAEATGYSDISKVLYTDKGSSSTAVTEAQANHNYVFYVRGGAARNPWYDADKTLYYNPGTSLGETMLKIDNPRIIVEKNVVNNMPEDEKAVFKMKVINETEYEGDVTKLNPSFLTLYVADDYNPNGAKFYMDGMPLTMGKQFNIKPGATLVKTFEVERGSDYDFENLKLVLRDESMSLSDTATVSVHYLPVASPVAIATPEDKWTMNTLSAQDADGRYYIPVSLDGFNVNSDGFHHIELQYKKETEGESKWTKVCSFFTDEALMAEATGEKELIPSSGKIQNIRFYGEKDPVEMNYDLRAVAFRKFGNGFITRESNVVKGTKDTRCPVVFGSPKPANGILTYSDVISIPFNEPIAYNYLDQTANFQVTGYMNDSENSYSTALYFPRGEDILAVQPGAWSKVDRSLAGNDFTVDAMVKLDDGLGGEVFSIYNPGVQATSVENQDVDYISLYVSLNSIYVYTDGYIYYSRKFSKWDLSSSLNRVTLTFTQPDNTPVGEPQVKLYVNGEALALQRIYTKEEHQEIDPTDRNWFVECNAKGKVIVGQNFKGGNITDVRLWNRALPSYEVTQKRNMRLSTNENGLVGYWPMNEGTGQVAYDQVYGADLYFDRQSWQSTKTQYGLRLDGEELELRNVNNLSRFNSYDYTLSLWANISSLEGDSVTIFRTGEDVKGGEYFRLGTFGNNLVLDTRNDEVGSHRHIIAVKNAVEGNGWHNIIVTANKSQNVASFYIDGKLQSTISGDELAGTSKTNVVLGDKNFHGTLDNISFWDHAFPANSISTLYNRQPSGFEMGLILNMPFEEDKSNVNGELVTVFSPRNIIYKALKDGGYAQFDTVFVEKACTPESLERLTSSSDYCPIQTVAGVKTLPFSWTATDNELQINLNVDDSKINHQNISVVVRSVEDLSGNSMLSPQRMVLYVDKNVLKWTDKQLNVEIPYGEGAKQEVVFTNESGRQLYYNLTEYCSWLKLDRQEGYISALGEETVTLTFDEGMAPGEYYSCIYLKDENNLISQLPITVTVVADEPEWEVTTDPEYRLQMNVVGQVKLKNAGGKEYIDIDENDIVYAFHKGVCLGKANITMDNEDAFVYITVKGSNAMLPYTSIVNGRKVTYPAADVEFRLWRASLGTNSYLDVSYTDSDGEHSIIRFKTNATIGNSTSPVMLTPSTKTVQFFNLKKGWNWISFNVDPKHDLGVNNLFISDKEFTVGDLFGTLHSGTYSSLQYDYKWSNGAEGVLKTRNRVYQVYAHNDCSPSIAGYLFADSARYVTLSKPNAWNELAYLGTESKRIDVALADYSPGQKALDGTIIMSRDEFAQVDNGKWRGSLQYMHPGQGYYVYHKGDAGVRIQYSSENTATKVARRRAAAQMQETVAISKEYVGSMPVIATYAEGNDYLEGDQLVAYANGEEIGRAALQTLDDGRQRFFIMLSAAPNSQITWAQERDGETIATSKSKIKYNAMTVAGSVGTPLAIDFVGNSDSGADVQYYGTNGVRVVNTNNVHGRVLIGNDGTKILKK